MYYNSSVYNTQTHGHIFQPKKQHNTHGSPLSALFDLSLRELFCLLAFNCVYLLNLLYHKHITYSKISIMCFLSLFILSHPLTFIYLIPYFCNIQFPDDYSLPLNCMFIIVWVGERGVIVHKNKVDGRWQADCFYPFW